MFKKKEQDDILFHKGIIKAKMPYSMSQPVADENDNIKVYYCDVELHIGNQNDLKNGYLATAIISARKDGIGVTNFIERLADQTVNLFLNNVIISRLGTPVDKIRWIERNYYPSENFQVVKLEWNEKYNYFTNPKWEHLNEGDWILKDHRLEDYKDQ
jgi:hypothetical protein